MGSFLSKPITDKVSTEESNDRFNCGTSAMQGWRVSQEDAHNCLLDYDADAAFFAVYDGHGGPEVSQYCALKLPDYLKDNDAYKAGDYTKALEEAFLGFDATILKPEVIEELKVMAQVGKVQNDEADSEDEDENVSNLYEEASMPIEEVLEKYKSNLLNAAVKTVENKTTSPSKADKHAAGSSSSSGSSKGDVVSSSSSSEAKTSEASSSSSKKLENGGLKESAVDLPDSSLDGVECTQSSKDEKQNGDVCKKEESKAEDVTSSSTPVQNGESPTKGKGKAQLKRKGVTPEKAKDKKSRPKRSVNEIYAKLLTFSDSDDESEDEEDKTFEGPKEPSSDDDDEGVDDSKMDDGSSEEDDDEDDDEDEEEDSSEDGDLTDSDIKFAQEMNEAPGSDSGCTAVVALMKGNSLYVANAGDSRCIVCRKGEAVDMSIDHKPDDKPERDRVYKAGGRVSRDGRVNSGLNLSRAIGDHSYKQNKELSDREQMIIALPDVRTLTINPNEDEFMVLACDGIWNFMSSQEVVDFVRPAIKEGKALSKICEEMFDHCLAPDTHGDGTGCDNMTAIIVQFKSTLLKRRPSEEAAESDNKRVKTDGDVDAGAEAKTTAV